jgi:NAD(P)-dependent dehydrogenase (short-subunit alcohol dehydrogenase family)
MTTAVTEKWEATGGVMPKSVVPQQRMGLEEEFAGTILFMASKAGGYCNGNVMVIDGGYLQNHAGSY